MNRIAVTWLHFMYAMAFLVIILLLLPSRAPSNPWPRFNYHSDGIATAEKYDSHVTELPVSFLGSLRFK